MTTSISPEILNMLWIDENAAWSALFPASPATQNIPNESHAEVEVQTPKLNSNLALPSDVRKAAEEVARLASDVAQFQARVEQLQASVMVQLHPSIAALSREVKAIRRMLEGGQGNVQPALFEQGYQNQAALDVLPLEAKQGDAQPVPFDQLQNQVIQDMVEAGQGNAQPAVFEEYQQLQNQETQDWNSMIQLLADLERLLELRGRWDLVEIDLYLFSGDLAAAIEFNETVFSE